MYGIFNLPIKENPAWSAHTLFTDMKQSKLNFNWGYKRCFPDNGKMLNDLLKISITELQNYRITG